MNKLLLGNTSSDKRIAIVNHLINLRNAIILSLAVVVIAAFVSFYFSEILLDFILNPMQAFNTSLIVTRVTEAFIVRIKLSFLAGFIVTFPLILWFFWRNFKTLLPPEFRKYIYIIIPSCMIMFVSGMCFAYFIVLQAVLNFFIYMAGDLLEPVFKVEQFVSFVMAFTLPFGLIFQMPVVTFFLAKLGIIQYEKMAKNRKYAALVIVILAALLTPGPDPFSQLIMGIPMYLLYEISILLARISVKRSNLSEPLE